MSTRCKPGDLAIIMYDVPQCAANIGRAVEISGPAEYDRHGRLTWLIQPVTAEPYPIATSNALMTARLVESLPPLQEMARWDHHNCGRVRVGECARG